MTFLQLPSQPRQNGQPSYNTSAMADAFVPHPNAYDDYVVATSTVPPVAAGPGYQVGWATGYSVLTGGLAPDIPLWCACSQILAARKNKPGTGFGYGEGCLDVWRLLVEQGLDVNKVIAAALL